MTLSTSAVAVCCCSASLSSRVSRAIFFLSEAEMADLGAERGFGAERDLGAERGLGAVRAAGRRDRAAALEPRFRCVWS